MPTSIFLSASHLTHALPPCFSSRWPASTPRCNCSSLAALSGCADAPLLSPRYSSCVASCSTCSLLTGGGVTKIIGTCTTTRGRRCSRSEWPATAAVYGHQLRKGLSTAAAPAPGCGPGRRPPAAGGGCHKRWAGLEGIAEYVPASRRGDLAASASGHSAAQHRRRNKSFALKMGETARRQH